MRGDTQSAYHLSSPGQFVRRSWHRLQQSARRFQLSERADSWLLMAKCYSVAEASQGRSLSLSG